MFFGFSFERWASELGQYAARRQILKQRSRCSASTSLLPSCQHCAVPDQVEPNAPIQLPLVLFMRRAQLAAKVNLRMCGMCSAMQSALNDDEPCRVGQLGQHKGRALHTKLFTHRHNAAMQCAAAASMDHGHWTVLT